MGILLHAFGDSYAHTYIDDKGNTCAFGGKVGHAMAPGATSGAVEDFGASVDWIRERGPAGDATYQKYLRDLAAMLGATDQKAVDALIRAVMPHVVSITYGGGEITVFLQRDTMSEFTNDTEIAILKNRRCGKDGKSYSDYEGEGGYYPERGRQIGGANLGKREFISWFDMNLYLLRIKTCFKAKTPPAETF